MSNTTTTPISAQPSDTFRKEAEGEILRVEKLLKGIWGTEVKSPLPCGSIAGISSVDVLKKHFIPEIGVCLFVTHERVVCSILNPVSWKTLWIYKDESEIAATLFKDPNGHLVIMEINNQEVKVETSDGEKVIKFV